MLDTISGDRIRHELELILKEELPEKTLRRAEELKVLTRLHHVDRRLPLRRRRNGQRPGQEQHANHHRYENNRPPAQEEESGSHTLTIPASATIVKRPAITPGTHLRPPA